MAHSSILGADRAPPVSAGRDRGALGPSDTSDSGADIRGRLDLDEADQQLSDLRPRVAGSDDRLREEMDDADTDGTATGERASAILSEDLRDGGDIAPDRIVDSLDDIGSGAEASDDIGDADLAAASDEAQNDADRGKRAGKPSGVGPDGALDCAEWLDQPGG